MYIRVSSVVAKNMYLLIKKLALNIRSAMKNDFDLRPSATMILL
jgi:hypothetical protein